MYSMRLGNQLFVVVSDPQIVKDLVVTNGAIFSSRKEMFMKSQIIFARRGITATPYNETWCADFCNILDLPWSDAFGNAGGSTAASLHSS